MKGSAYLAIFILQILFCCICFAQTGKIDSLKKVLPGSKDSLRIDCLNALSYEYLQFRDKNSATYYDSLAFKDAMHLNYIHGIAESYAQKAGIELTFTNDFFAVERFATQSLLLYEKTANKKNIETPYFQIGFAQLAQSSFDKALQNLRLSYNWRKANKNTAEIFIVSAMIATIYKEMGDYDNFFKLIKEGHDLALQTNNKALQIDALFHTGEIYMKLGDYHAALASFRQAWQMDTPELAKIRRDWDFWVKMEYAEIYSNLRQFDSAWYYYNLFKPGKDNKSYDRVYLLSSGECHFLQANYTPALQNFLLGLEYNKKVNDRNQVMRALLDIAKTYSALHNDTAALRYAREVLGLSMQSGSRQFTRDASQILYLVFEKFNQRDSASHYFRQYINTKDIIAADQAKGKLIAYNYEQKIDLLDKEKAIQKAKFKKESFFKKMLIVGILGLLLLGFFLLRTISLKRKNEAHKRKIAENELLLQKFENEKTKAELEQQATELEMQALRAQMNPHFIFNSLNSINRFILQNNKTQASEYLTKFSKLVRMILQNSQASLITLENELESLELYLELEALRFDYRFDYKITIQKDLDVDMLKVPPLIIQPFAENAIWHGLMHKEEKGQLDIEVNQTGDLLFLRIADNGIGRKAAAELSSKSATRHKSVGLKITADRIAMVNSSGGNGSAVTINDLVDADGSAAGTEVTIKIPVKYD